MKKLLLLLLLTICFTVSKAQVPTPNPANGQNYCIGTTVVYGPETPNPGSTYTYSISPTVPFTTLNPNTQISVIWSTQGTYTLTLTETNASGCTSTTTATINVNPINTANNTAQVCVNSTTQLTIGLPSGGVWSGTGVNSTGLFDATGLAPGDYTITYTGNDSNGCPYIGTVIVTVLPLPTPVIFSNQ